MAQSRVARAEDETRAENGMVWGVASFELAAPLTLAAMAAWDPDAFQSSRYALYMAPPIGVALGIGLLGYQQEWGTAIPRTTHGVPPEQLQHRAREFVRMLRQGLGSQALSQSCSLQG